MKRLFAIALGAFAVSACQDVAGPKAPVSGPEGPTISSAVQADTIPGQYIVLLNSSVADPEAATQELMWNRRAAIEHTYQYAVKGFAAKLSKAQADSLSRNPNVAVVQPDLRVKAQSLTVESDPTWGLDRVDEHDYPLDSRYSYGATGSGVNVYVIDGGIRLTHNEFGGRAHFAFDAFGGSGVDCRGHGTHVAATIAGATYGVAKKATVYDVKVLDCDGNSTLSKIVAGVDWVTGHRKLPAVANMSLGSVGNAIFDSVVKASIAKGVTYVASAGNDDTDACKQSPARVSQVLTVGAIKEGDYRASWSNYGSCVDLFAPGDLITSAYYTSDGATRVMSGTSMASPHVAGVAALYLSAHPSATPADVRSAIVGNATTGRVHDAAGTANRIVYSGFISGSSTTTTESTTSSGSTTSTSSMDPVASFTYSCSGNTCTFDASASTAPRGLLSRSWKFGDGTEAGGGKVTKTYAAAGTYTVRFYIYDIEGHYDLATKSVTVGSTATSSSTTSTSSSSTWSYTCGTNRVCSFDARALEADGAYAFSWYFGDGTQAGSSYVPQKWYASSGSYTVKMVAVKDGQIIRISKTISVP